jgi:hypothetical protein
LILKKGENNMKVKITIIFLIALTMILSGCGKDTQIFGGCEEKNNQDQFCIDKIPDFPEEIGTYNLEPFSKSNWREDCAELEGKEYCLRSVRAEYYDENKNIAIHVMPRYITKGKESVLHKLIVEKYSGEETIPEVYRLLEEHELYWAPSVEFDQIMTQEYSYDYTTSGKKTIFRKADPENEVVKYFLENYPAEITNSDTGEIYEN